MKDKIDTDLVTKSVLEIGSLHKKIMKEFPRDSEILKHLAASSIHLTFFMRDFYENIVNKNKPKGDEIEKEFLEACGCNFNEEK